MASDRASTSRASGLPINKGIIVNDTLATEVPGVYAIGECAEHGGRTYGIVAPAWEQADVSGRRCWAAPRTRAALPRLEDLHRAC